MSQYRGTTPTHIFETDIDLRPASLIFLTYTQGEGCHKRVIFEKTQDDMEITENTVTVRLTQEETLKFCPDMGINMQFRATFGNKAVACNIMYAGIDDVLKGGVI